MKDAKSFYEGLTESLFLYWNKFLLMLPRIVLAILIAIIIFYLAAFVARLIRRKLDGEAHDPLLINFMSKVSRTAVIICGIMLIFQTLGLNGLAGGLLAGAGISAFIFGFAFKDIAENFLGGVILAFNRPFQLNDTIAIREYSGHIIALNFRTTHIKTFDGKDVFIPNSIVVKEPLTNMTRDGKIRLDFAVGIAYEDDIDAAIQTIIKTLEPIEDLKQDMEPFTVVEELGVSTVNLRIYFWCNTFDYKKGILQIKSEVFSKVKRDLMEKGFSLPADIQEIKLYDKKEPLPINILNLKDVRTG
jgi:small-conductance mechanosensitive channel